MKLNVLFLFLLAGLMANAQENTEIVLFDLETEPQIKLSNFKNVSNNEGYDNQPSFLSETRLLFASTRNGQTDIAQYFADYNSKIWINFTEGGEYSPQKIPLRNEVSAVRLEKDGTQTLQRYNLGNGEDTPLVEDLVVAYYVWVNDQTIISSVIEGEQLNLYLIDLSSNSNKKIAENVGRSLHLIPDTNLVSFISKEESAWKIKSFNLKTEKTRLLANTVEGVEDMCWLDRRTILSGKESELYRLRLQRDTNWKKIADLGEYGIKDISRLAVNISATKIAMAATLDSSRETEPSNNTNEESQTATAKIEDPAEVEAIVQAQTEAYNKRDIEAYMAAYSDDVKLFNFPNVPHTESKAQMKEGYTQWFDNAPDLKAEILKRTVIGNKVIDETKVTANGQTFTAVAIYEVKDGLINRVTFIQ